MTPKNWELSFDEEFKHEDFGGCAAHDEGLLCCIDDGHPRNKSVKDFIRTLVRDIETEAYKKGFIDGRLPDQKE